MGTEEDGLPNEPNRNKGQARHRRVVTSRLQCHAEPPVPYWSQKKKKAVTSIFYVFKFLTFSLSWIFSIINFLKYYIKCYFMRFFKKSLLNFIPEKSALLILPESLLIELLFIVSKIPDTALKKVHISLTTLLSVIRNILVWQIGETEKEAAQEVSHSWQEAAGTLIQEAVKWATPRSVNWVSYWGEKWHLAGKPLKPAGDVPWTGRGSEPFGEPSLPWTFA